MENVVLIGTPNSGKTTLFNWLTGRNQKVVNYPGSTVDYSRGSSLDVYGDQFSVFDSPGTYSLKPKSPEEEVTLRLLYDPQKKFEAAVAVVDSTQLERQLPLVQQLKEVGMPVVVALTMKDLHQLDNQEIPAQKIEQEIGVPVVAVDGLLGKGVDELVKRLREVQSRSDSLTLTEWGVEKYNEVLKGSRELASRMFGSELSVRSQTDKLDSVFLHPIFGGIIFCSVMVLLFSSIFWAATPFMDIVDEGFSGLAEWTGSVLPANLLNDFISNGIISSMGAVLVFVPQIFILFIGITALEESGYLARAATIVDRPLSKVGMTGRSFVPLLSGFACAVPAVMAARSVKSPLARWLTVFVIPFMTCSARLPVYALLISFLFLGKSAFMAGMVLAMLYIGAIVLSLISSAILSKFVKTARTDSFAMELPLYRMPNPVSVLKQALRKTKSYVMKAGPIIFVFAVIVWLGSTFPNHQAEEPLRTQQSYMAQVGQALEPAFEPMGVDWKVGVGMISAFAAREVFVSTLATIMNITAEDEDTIQESLIAKMQNAERPNGDKMFTIASIAGLLVFFMIALQCMSTVGVVIKEMGSWTYGIGQLVAMNSLAFLLAVVTFQTLKLFGFDT